ncbi:MAG: hypothetical protein MZV63_21905 [Marinilabiliales bacterium]|nr:hypothetical protein [Marinilabiliales bacterium]
MWLTPGDPVPTVKQTRSTKQSIMNDIVYAATAKGVFSAPLSRTGLSYFGNWERLEGLPSPGSKYDNIAAAGSALFISKPAAPHLRIPCSGSSPVRMPAFIIELHRKAASGRLMVTALAVFVSMASINIITLTARVQSSGR